MHTSPDCTWESPAGQGEDTRIKATSNHSSCNPHTHTPTAYFAPLKTTYEYGYDRYGALYPGEVIPYGRDPFNQKTDWRECMKTYPKKDQACEYGPWGPWKNCTGNENMYVTSGGFE